MAAEVAEVHSWAPRPWWGGASCGRGVHGEAIVGRRIFGVKGDGLLVGGDGFLMAAEVAIHIAEAVVGVSA